MPLFDIAGCTLEFSGFENNFFNHRFEGYQAKEDASPLLKVSMLDEIFMPQGKHISVADNFRHYYKQADGYGIYDLLKSPDTYCASMWFDDEVKSAKTALSDISDLGGMNLEVRGFNMLGELFRYFILKNNGIVLHSSCIKYKDVGIAFSAPSGTGKSTHTGLWKKYFLDDVTVLNDDSPAIKFGRFAPEVYGTPWSGKTEININEGAPLEAIVFLQQHPTNEITEISSDEAVFRILQEVTRPVFPEFMELTLAAVEKLVVQTPTYLLRCNISEEAVLTVKNKLGI